MELFLLGGLTLCLFFFLGMLAVHCITIEKSITELAELVERKVKQFYQGE
jgi:hypothetical protein